MQTLSAVGAHRQRGWLSIRCSLGLTRLSTKNNGASLSQHTDHHDSNTSLAALRLTKYSFSSKAKSWDSRQSQAWENSRRLCQWPTATSRFEMQIFAQGSISAPSKQNISCSIQRSSSRPHQCPHNEPTGIIPDCLSGTSFGPKNGNRLPLWRTPAIRSPGVRNTV